MEKKNTILLTVIAIATLLVAVVGATFAYFTAQVTTQNNEQNRTEVNTATLASATMDFGRSVTMDDVYPGAKVVKSVYVKGTCGDGGTACNAIEANIGVTPSASIGTDFLSKEADSLDESDIVWSLYRSTNPVVCKNPRTASTGEPNKTITGEGENATSSTTTTNQYQMVGDCRIVTEDMATAMADFTTQEEIDAYVATISDDDWNDLALVSSLDAVVLDATTKGDGLLMSGDKTADTAKISVDGTTKDYYYLVVSYLDRGNQDLQQGKNFKIDLSFTAEPVK